MGTAIDGRGRNVPPRPVAQASSLWTPGKMPVPRCSKRLHSGVSGVSSASLANSTLSKVWNHGERAVALTAPVSEFANCETEAEDGVARRPGSCVTGADAKHARLCPGAGARGRGGCIPGGNRTERAIRRSPEVTLQPCGERSWGEPFPRLCSGQALRRTVPPRPPSKDPCIGGSGRGCWPRRQVGCSLAARRQPRSTTTAAAECETSWQRRGLGENTLLPREVQKSCRAQLFISLKCYLTSRKAAHGSW